MSGITSGTLRTIRIAGTPFTPLGDVDATLVLGAYTNEAVATAGDNIRKKTRRVQSIEGITIGCSETEADVLQAYADNNDDVPLSVTTASGATYRATGWIQLENWTSADAKADVKLFPRGSWELFAA